MVFCIARKENKVVVKLHDLLITNSYQIQQLYNLINYMLFCIPDDRDIQNENNLTGKIYIMNFLNYIVMCDPDFLTIVCFQSE